MAGRGIEDEFKQRSDAYKKKGVRTKGLLMNLAKMSRGGAGGRRGLTTSFPNIWSKERKGRTLAELRKPKRQETTKILGPKLRISIVVCIPGVRGLSRWRLADYSNVTAREP